MYRLRGVRGAAGVRGWRSAVPWPAPLQRRVAMETGSAIHKVAAAAHEGLSVPRTGAVQSSTLTAAT